MIKIRNNGNAAKASLGYTIGNYLVRGLGFITVPIFSRILSTSDFGLYNTFLAYEAILYIFIGLTLNGSIKSAKYKFEGKIDEYTSSVMILPIIVALFFLLIWFIAKDFISSLLSIDATSLLLLVFYSYASGLLVLYQSRISLEYNYKEYLKLSLFNALSSVLLSVILIFTFFSRQRYLGRITGGTITYIIIAIYIIYKLSKKSIPKYNREYWKYGLKISLPLIPHGLAQILLLSFDRIMINSMIGSSEAGIYSFAYTIYSLVQISSTSLDTVYSTWVFKKLHEDNAKKEVKKIGTCFMIFIGGACVVTMLLAPEIIYVLGGKKYEDAIYSVVPVISAGFFAMSYCIPAVMEYYYEKTKYISIGTSIAAFLNVTLNYIFIPKFGYVAAAYTTLFSYVIYFSLHTYISKKLSGFSIIKLKYFIGLIPILICSYTVSLKWHETIWVRLSVLLVLITIGCIMLISAYGITDSKILFKTIRTKIGGKK